MWAKAAPRTGSARVADGFLDDMRQARDGSLVRNAGSDHTGSIRRRKKRETVEGELERLDAAQPVRELFQHAVDGVTVDLPEKTQRQVKVYLPDPANLSRPRERLDRIDRTRKCFARAIAEGNRQESPDRIV